MTSSATRPGNANLPSGASCLPLSPLPLPSSLFPFPSLHPSSPDFSLWFLVIFPHVFFFDLLARLALLISAVVVFPFLPVQIPLSCTLIYLPRLFVLFLLCHLFFSHPSLRRFHFSDPDKNPFVKLLNRDFVSRLAPSLAKTIKSCHCRTPAPLRWQGAGNSGVGALSVLLQTPLSDTPQVFSPFHLILKKSAQEGEYR